MIKFFITGGAGFIGSHFCEEIFNSFKNSRLIIYDKLTYAANKNYLSKIINSPRVTFVKGDICDQKKYFKLLKNIDVAVNVAAESHVDNSFKNSINFTKNNTLGTHTFFQNCLNNGVKNIVHISTDEVYGDKLKGKSSENDRLDPTNPYSASKAAAEMIVSSYKFYTNKKIIIIRSNNIFGTRQYPEKLIPHCITRLIKNKKIRLHGDGNNKRCYLAVEDFSKAVVLLIKKKKSGIYNIGSNNINTNFEVAKKVCKYLGFEHKKKIEFIKDRLFNDKRYYVEISKIKKIGWKPEKKLFHELPRIIEWYKKNIKNFKDV